MLYTPPTPEERLKRVEIAVEELRTTVDHLRRRTELAQSQVSSSRDTEEVEPENQTQNVGSVWYPAGAVLAGLLSWWEHHSLWWAIPQGILSWLYVGYRFVRHLIASI